MLELDGSRGEGGGQIVRTAASLGAATATEFRMTNIRAGRSNPGLRPQHVTALRACADASDATLEGAEPGARNVTFRAPELPSAVDAEWEVGTAGSTTLVLHAVLAPLLLAEGTSELLVDGGTHTLRAPVWEHFDRSFLPLLERVGAEFETRLERHGFYPAGGGRVRVAIHPPADGLQPLRLPRRDGLESLEAISILANLPGHIARRELETFADALPVYEFARRVRRVEETDSPGNALVAEVRADPADVLVSKMGRKGLPAEAVARELADRTRPFLESDAAVDRRLADQLLVPLALAGSGRVTTTEITTHCRTQMELIPQFLDVSFTTDRLDASTVAIAVRSS